MKTRKEQIYGPPLRLSGAANDFIASQIEESGVLAYADRFGGRQTVIQVVKEAVSGDLGRSAFDRNLTKEEIREVLGAHPGLLTLSGLENFAMGLRRAELQVIADGR